MVIGVYHSYNDIEADVWSQNDSSVAPEQAHRSDGLGMGSAERQHDSLWASLGSLIQNHLHLKM